MALETVISIPALRWDAPVPYLDAARRQEELVAEKREALILCEHPPTITLGTSARPEDLHFPSAHYQRMNVQIHKSPRGGRATYHGPGQLVCYPIINLRERNRTIQEHLRFLEELMIELCESYHIHAHRIDGKAGAWVEDRKIGFIGVRVRRGFAFHGFSINITPQKEAFRLITPCGMPDLCVTSIQEESGEAPSITEAADRIEALFFGI